MIGTSAELTGVARYQRYTDPMANLTIVTDDETLRRARIRALERGESVNQYLAERLREYAGIDEERARRQTAAEAFVELSTRLAGNSGGVEWTREELYDERLGADR